MEIVFLAAGIMIGIIIGCLQARQVIGLSSKIEEKEKTIIEKDNAIAASKAKQILKENSSGVKQ
jgi:hypothetical protein